MGQWFRWLSVGGVAVVAVVLAASAFKAGRYGLGVLFAASVYWFMPEQKWLASKKLKDEYSLLLGLVLLGVGLWLWWRNPFVLLGMG